jgi:CRP-like cAMP-binding protein
MRSLHSIEKLKSLTVVQLQRIMDLMKEESFLPGEVLLRQGEMTNKFAIIIEGHCQVIRRLSTGEEMEEDVLDCADFFGEGALLAPLPSEITIIASDHVTLFQVRVCEMCLSAPLMLFRWNTRRLWTNLGIWSQPWP